MIVDVIDDFLPQPYFEMIKDRITHPNFPWYFKKDITYPTLNQFQNWSQEKSINQDFNSYGLDHFVVEDGNIRDECMFDFLSGFFGSIINISQKSQVSKCRIDMTLYTKPKYKHIPHVDIFADHTVTIFYVIDSDGETELYDKLCYSFDEYSNLDLFNFTPVHTIEPKENRLLMFNGRYLHTGHSPSKNKNRILINTDLVK